jgi:hypothetical protein
MSKYIKQYFRDQDGKIYGVVVATGPGKVGWSFINPSEKVGLISKAKKDKDGNIIKDSVYGIDPKDCTLAIKRAEEKIVSNIPNIPASFYLDKAYNKNSIAKVIGKMFERSLKYFQS